MLAAGPKPDLVKRCVGALERFVRAGKLQRQGYVLAGCHGRDQMERLEDDADGLGAKRCAAILARLRDVAAGDDNPAAAHALEPGRHHQQRAFARARRTDDADRVASLDREIHILEDCYRTSTARQRQLDLIELNGVHGLVLSGFDWGIVKGGAWSNDVDLPGACVPSQASPMTQALPKPLLLLLELVAVSIAFFALGARPALASEPITIVAFGDSLTAGYGLAAADSFPAKLEAALRERGHDVTVINAGVSGDTVEEGLARLDWSVPDTADAVIVELGANNALRGMDPSAAREALDELIGRLRARKAEVLIAGMEASRSLGHAYVEVFGTMYPDLAQKYDTLLYPFFLEGVALIRRSISPTAWHPNPKGVDVIVWWMLASVEALIARVEAKRGQ